MIGRPQPSEAAEYYWKYINEVHGEDPQAVMDAQVEDLDTICCALSDERSLHRYEPGKWSIRQVLNHVTDTERAFVFRALWFARGFDTPLPSYDQETAAAGALADSIPWHDHIDEFRNVRLATLSFFRNLPPTAWDRGGIASDKRFTVRAIAYIIPGHVAYHMRLLKERYLK